MATYQADITKSVEPAMANPSTLLQAGASTRSAIQTLGEGLGTAYKGYVSQEIASVEQSVQDQAAEFYISRQAAEQAGLKAQQLEKTRPVVGSMFDAAMSGANSNTVQEQAIQSLKSFDDKILQLKNAAEGGMSPEAFQANVNSTIRKAISRYPGMADEIRSRVAGVTGIDLATQAFVGRYIKDAFTPKKEVKQETEADMAMKDMSEASKTGSVGTSAQLFNLYNNDRPEYNRRMEAWQQTKAVDTQRKTIENNLATLTLQSDDKADAQQGSFAAIFNGGLQTTTMTEAVLDREKSYANVVALFAAGKTPTTDPVAFQASVAVHTAQMRTNIEASRTAALNVVQKYIEANPKLSPAKRQELKDNIDRQAKDANGKYADEKGVGLLTMANIFKTYRDKSLAEKSQLIDLALKQRAASGASSLDSAYYAGGESRENLKRTNPFFYEQMVVQEKELRDAINGVSSMINSAGGKSLAHVENVINASLQDPKEIKPNPAVPVNVTKAAYEALHSHATELLKKTALVTSEINSVSAAFSTNVATGANSQLLAKHYKRYGDEIMKLPEVDQAVIKDTVSTSVKGAVTSITGVKNALEAKYKVKLNLGVNDAGQIMAMPTGIGTPRAGLKGAAANVRTIASPEEYAAIQEFMNKAKPMLDNVVYGTSMLTKQEPKVVGAEIGTLINNNQPYGGFYTKEAKPIPVATPAATPKPAASSGKLTVGEEVNGFVYKGGDPNVESNWSAK